MPNKRVDIVTLRLIKDSSVAYSTESLNSPELAQKLISSLIEDSDREVFIVVCLDVKNRPTNINVCAIGTLSGIQLHPREVFKTAILSNASSIIVGHNHPSGDCRPSSDDLAITKRFISAGKLLGIPLLDHVIVSGNGKYLSLKREGHLRWDEHDGHKESGIADVSSTT